MELYSHFLRLFSETNGNKFILEYSKLHNATHKLFIWIPFMSNDLLRKTNKPNENEQKPKLDKKKLKHLLKQYYNVFWKIWTAAQKMH